MNFLLALLATAAAATASPTVTTPLGDYTGIEHPTLPVSRFLGVPYAQPPTGQRRFAPPAPITEPWSTPVNATAFGPECLGYGLGLLPGSGAPMSEDCLTVNVWTPTTSINGTSDEKLPVVVWIHGGAMVAGGAASSAYDWSNFVANERVVGVSLQYRLSGWGFFASEELLEQRSVNVALQDQREALRWVKRNIAAFGGDPEKVTIWGESAGALSVGLHLIGWGGTGDGLFHRAVLSSGGPITMESVKNISYYQQLYEETLAATNCPDIACLRELPTETLHNLFAARPAAWSNPVIDNFMLDRLPSASVEAHRFAKVPLLVGSTSDEGTLFTPTNLNSSAEFRAFVATGDPGATLSEASITKIMLLYPDAPSIQLPRTYELNPAEVGTQYKRAVTWTSDYLFIAGRRATAEAYVEAGQDVWSYRFDTPSAILPPRFGAAHSTELRYFFNTPDFTIPQQYRWLVAEMSGRLGAFVRGEAPQFEGAMEWPKYGRLKRQIVFAGTDTRTYEERDIFRAAGMNFINELNPVEFNR